MKKIYDWLTGGVLKEVGGILDDLVTTKEEKLNIEVKLKEIALKASLESQKLQSSIISDEAKGNFLQRSWRPIVMLCFTLIVVFHYFLYPILLTFGNFPELPLLTVDFWGLLQIGIGGYVGGRTIEKVVPQILDYKKTKIDKDANV
ncbi:structural protein [Cellulophaga phage phi48:2]|uniref:holin n=1 Tax=Cellulophaga phage phi48:2 TaxID=1327968 RepID=UPI000351F090|nr:holin [Cellulophaga phage phi48:2]AGO47269.1 structural protein [Cellulophaga phage phi48:2]